MDWAEGAKSFLSKRTWVVVSLVFVHSSKLIHVFIADVEIEKAEVFNLACWVGTFGDHSSTSLDTPSKENLGRGLSVLSCKLLDERNFHKALILLCHSKLNIRASSEATVGHDLNTSFTAHS